MLSNLHLVGCFCFAALWRVLLDLIVSLRDFIECCVDSHFDEKANTDCLLILSFIANCAIDITLEKLKIRNLQIYFVFYDDKHLHKHWIIRHLQSSISMNSNNFLVSSNFILFSIFHYLDGRAPLTGEKVRET